jgi:hypothetical protein
MQVKKDDYNWVLGRMRVTCQNCKIIHYLKIPLIIKIGLWIALWGGNSKEWCLEQFLNHNPIKK